MRTELISERIIIEAKRELYPTNKATKEIAYEPGYEDEYYFSRLFRYCWLPDQQTLSRHYLLHAESVIIVIP
jgi:transcriptional regulator GlxA family with amidase domain